jgi:hypothetical protein
MTDLPQFNPTDWDTKSRAIPTDPIFDGALFDPKAAAEAARRQRVARLDPLEAPLGLIPTTSFSGLSNFEKCPYHSYLSKVKKCPDVAGAAAQRGTEIHDKAENFITGQSGDDLPKELIKFKELFEDLRARYPEGLIHVEEDWAFTREWDETGWSDDNTWLRMKLDALDRQSDTSAKVYDWKTGRKFGNEVKHGQQALLYVIATFIKYPELEFVEANMIYTDKGEKMTTAYSRDQAMLFFDRYNLRFNQATTCVDFKPTPNASACKWCPHSKVQEGLDDPACQWRYTA